MREQIKTRAPKSLQIDDLLKKNYRFVAHFSQLPSYSKIVIAISCVLRYLRSPKAWFRRRISHAPNQIPI